MAADELAGNGGVADGELADMEATLDGPSGATGLPEAETESPADCEVVDS